MFAEKGLPLTFGPMVMASISGPATLAGTLAQENAEILFSSVAVEMIRPGVPVEYGGIPHILDQRTGNISLGSPEQGLMAAAISQIGRYYGFPVHINVGLTDSKIPDAQSGLEKGATLLMGALSGAELFGHMGISGADQGACFEQLVVDDEMASYIRRMLSSFRVDAETIAGEVIRDVGPGGSFLTKPHTLKHIMQEFWRPTLFDRNEWSRWVKAGAKDTVTAARERVNQILSSHQSESLDKDVEKEVDLIIKDAKSTLLGK
jgi:trimethylamine--corrinoid protein Co-methyltransferase